MKTPLFQEEGPNNVKIGAIWALRLELPRTASIGVLNHPIMNKIEDRVARIYFLWWVLLVGIGIASVGRLVFALARDKAVSAKIVLLVVSLLLVTGAGFMCPAMLTFDYNGISCSQNQLVISWLLHTAALATLVISFRSGSSKRARRYLNSR